MVSVGVQPATLGIGAVAEQGQNAALPNAIGQLGESAAQPSAGVWSN
jgi:hypothetical protein